MSVRLDPAFTVVQTIGPDGPIEWRVRRVDAHFAARSALLMQSIGAIIGQAETEVERLQRERRAAADLATALTAELVLVDQAAAQRELDAESPLLVAIAAKRQQATLAGNQARQRLLPRTVLNDRTMNDIVTRQQQLVVLCVRAVRQPGGEWEPLTFVTDEAQHDPDAGRPWIGVVDDTTLDQLIKAAWAPAKEAAERLASFRLAQERSSAPGATSDGGPVRSAST